MSIPEAAAKTPFGGTVAHGFLTLSLLQPMAAEVMLVPADDQDGGELRLREGALHRPGPSGKRVRGRFTLVSAEEKRPGQWQFRHTMSPSRSRARRSPL